MSAEHKPVFCTLCNISNALLSKDIGIIAYGMHKFAGYDAFIATHNNGEYPSLKYLSGLNLKFIPNVTGNFEYDAALWLWKNAKSIDVLNLYHMRSFTFSRAFIYKNLKPEGKIYLKLDGWPLSSQGAFWKRQLFRWLMKHSDCVSTEFEESAELLSREWQRKIICIPNPANPNELQDFRPFSERSNTILYAGRVEHEKGSHTLIEAFGKIAHKIPDWTLKLAGSISEDMNSAPASCSADPELNERVIFTGEIRDRKELAGMYMDAKIFAFPSRHESFGVALTEAMMQGCFAVTTNIQASTLLTDNFKFALGSDVDDVDGLAKNLLYACTHEPEIESLALEGREATLKRCDLKTCCGIIADNISPSR